MSISLVLLSFVFVYRSVSENGGKLSMNYPARFLLKHASMVYAMVTYSGSLHLSKRTSCLHNLSIVAQTQVSWILLFELKECVWRA